MATVADHVLDNHLCAVWLERDAVVAIVDDTVLNDNVAAAVSVPAVRVFGCVVALAVAVNVDIAKDYVGTVCYPVAIDDD